MRNEIENNQLRFGMAMVRKVFLLFRQNGMGMGNYFPIIQFMGVEKQNAICDDTKGKCQTKVTEKGQYFSDLDQS